MNKYLVELSLANTVFFGTHLVVEANNIEEAKVKAKQQAEEIEDWKEIDREQSSNIGIDNVSLLKED